MLLDLALAAGLSLRRPRAALQVNPVHEALLAGLGLTAPQDYLNLEGAIVSGHPDRHVMRLELGGISCYLKREHRVPPRDRLANCLGGFGFVSVSLREAQTLRTLAELGVPVPEWVAAGESTDGRAFLLVKDVGAAPNLRDFLTRRAPTDRRERRRLARRLAHQVAAVHRAGIAYPDLYAKHILVGDGPRFTFLDWQRGGRPRRLTPPARGRDLAALHASLSDELADADDRITFLLAYSKAMRDDAISRRALCAALRRRTRRLLRRSSVREQRLPVVGESQALHWVDGDRLCLTDTGRGLLDPLEVRRLAYDTPPGGRVVPIAGVRAELATRRSIRPLRRGWQAPECRRAAQMLREERLGGPRRLLAFGQWRRSWAVVDSFLLWIAGGPV